MLDPKTQGKLHRAVPSNPFGCGVRMRRTLVDFLSTAITSFNREEEDSSKDSKAPEDREEAVQISEGLGSSRRGELI
jgi:hypothetical protein